MAKYNLSEARALVGLTQTQLAESADVAVSTVSDLERGGNQNPGYGLVMRIINALRRAGLKTLKPEDIFEVPGLQEDDADQVVGA